MSVEIDDIEENLNIFKQTIEMDILKKEIKGLKPLGTGVPSAPALEPSAPPLDDTDEFDTQPVRETDDPPETTKENTSHVQAPPLTWSNL